MTKKEQNDAKKWAWESFATAHPHEAFEKRPGKFWKFFHEKRPKISRTQMEKILKETNK